MRRYFCVLSAIGLLFFSNAFCWGGLIENESFESFAEGKNPVANSDADGITKWMRWGFENNESSDLFARTGTRAFKAWHNGGIYQNFSEPVIPGKKYKVSAYMFTPSSDQLKGNSYGVVKLEWLNEKEEILFDETKESERFDATTSPHKWKLISVEGVAPETAMAGRIAFEFRAEDDGSGAIFWDDADVQETK